jgi:hypothetical protein
MTKGSPEPRMATQIVAIGSLASDICRPLLVGMRPPSSSTPSTWPANARST